MPSIIESVKIGLNAGKIIQGVKVDLFEKEYDLCEESSRNMSCNKRFGILNKKDDPYRTERIGRLGEKAFEKLTGLPVNFEYLEKGDKYDFIVDSECKIDVKTSLFSQNECGYITGVNKQGIKKYLTSNVFVFAYMSKEDKDQRLSSVVFLGYILREDVLKIPLIKSNYGEHKNYIVYYKNLKPIKPLIEAIRTRFD